MFFNNTSVSILKEIDTTGYWWCGSAVMFSVTNGKNTICEKYGFGNEDYECASQILVNGTPIVQAKIPECPTCKGLLARGYGMENIDCPELKAARECMNSGFVSITDSCKKIKPLLGLLGDGYYVLADTICLPSDGEGKFFYDASSELKEYDAVCDEYYCKWNFKCVRHFPLFLYPTQSSSLIDNERVEYYAQIMRSEKNPPRVLAYNYEGFMNMILDGHHKACAAASLGEYVRCLTIIRADGCTISPEDKVRGVDIRRSNPNINTVLFSGLETEAIPGMRYLDIYGMRKAEKEEPVIQIKDLNEPRIHYGPEKYPTARDLMVLITAGEDIKRSLPDIDDDAIEALINDDSDDADNCLEALLHYLAATDHGKAYKLAGDILRKGDDRFRHVRVRSALLFMLDNRSDETEQLMTDFYLAHEEQDDIRDLVNSYWKDGSD